MVQDKKWHKLESGQAMMEYWPTIPAAIMIVISAGLIVSFLRGSFSQTADVLNRVNIEVCETTEEESTGPDSSIVDRHLFELVSVNFDGTNTTVVYRVTSAAKYSLSHWTLSIPKSVADNIIDESEPWSWTDNDPTTGAVGIKFDTGYDGEGGSGGTGSDIPKGNNGVGNGEDDQPPGDPPINDGEGTSPGNPGNKGGPKKHKSMTRQIMNARLLQIETTTTIGFADGETREIVLTLSGEYEFEPVTVTTKSANDDGVTGTISAPVKIIDLGTIRKGCESV